MYVALALPFVCLVATACVEPSQARVTETPEQLLNDNDCSAYKPVKGVMPGAGAPAKVPAEGEAPRPLAEDPCAKGSATAPP